MPHINTIFSELLKLLPRRQFEKAVLAHGGDRYTKRFTAWNQFTTLLYAQISRKESLREIETGLSAHGERLYHLGLTGVRRSTLADANNRRDAGIFETLFYALLERCRDHTPKHRFRFKNQLHSIDSTTIDLCWPRSHGRSSGRPKGSSNSTANTAMRAHCRSSWSSPMARNTTPGWSKNTHSP